MDRSSELTDERCRLIIESSHDLIYSCTSDGTITYVSPRIQSYGYVQHEVVGRNLKDFIHPDDQKQVIDDFQKTIELGEEFPTQMRIIRKDGSEAYVEEFGKAIKEGDQVIGIIGSMHDITERKQKEDALRESENKFRTLFEAAGEGIILFDTLGNIIDVNPRALEILCANEKEFIGKNIDHLLLEFKIDIRNTIQIFKEMIKLKKGRSRDWELIRRDGKIRIIRAHHSILAKEGKIVGFSIIFDDVTERRSDIQKLRDSEERYRLIFNSVNDIIVQLDKSGKIVDINSRVTTIAGYSRKEFVGKPLNALTPIFTPMSLAKMLANFARRMLGFDIKPYEVEAKTKNGQQIFFEISAIPLKDESGSRIGELGILHDVTERKLAENELRKAAQQAYESEKRERKRAFELEEAYGELKKTQQMLVQAEKMSAIGQLASGVAHEVKNPLGIIIQGINLLERIRPEMEAQRAETLAMIKDAVFRADHIIREMLDFAKPTEFDFKPARINEVIKRSVELVEKQFRHLNIKVDYIDAVQDVEIMIDKNQMEQVFVNILLNAFQALPKGGEIKLTTSIKKVGELEENMSLKFSRLLPSDKIYICEIEDTGSGIPKEKINRVFDPFFTTKAPGEGIGLGLSITRTIIEKHGGAIGIKGEEGKGTKVIIALPLKGGRQK